MFKTRQQCYITWEGGGAIQFIVYGNGAPGAVQNTPVEKKNSPGSGYLSQKGAYNTFYTGVAALVYEKY